MWNKIKDQISEVKMNLFPSQRSKSSFMGESYAEAQFLYFQTLPSLFSLSSSGHLQLPTSAFPLTWPNATVDFIFCHPSFFPLFQLGQYIWFADSISCSWEMIEDLVPLNWTGAGQDRRILHLRDWFSHLLTRGFALRTHGMLRAMISLWSPPLVFGRQLLQP